MIIDVNPFIYSRPVSPHDVIDRDDETNDLLRKVVGGHYVRLYAPRKYGKTSLLKRTLLDGEQEEGLIAILVDLYRVGSLTDVAIRFEAAYKKHLKGSVRDRVESFLQKTGLGLSLGAYGISARLQMGGGGAPVDPLPALHTLLDLPLRLEEGGGFRAFIALDEFQDVDKIPDLDGIIRSHIQHQGEIASYVFAGSEPGLMKQLFEDKDRPLYGSAVPMRLDRLADVDIAVYIDDRFKSSDRAVGEALNPLIEAAQGHPQRAMLLAHHLWEQVEQHSTGTLDDWSRAHEAALEELRIEFDARWRGFDSSEQKAMRAVSVGGGSPYKAQTLEQLELTKPAAQRAIGRLTGIAEIERRNGKQVIVDPLFEEWIERLNVADDDD